MEQNRFRRQILSITKREMFLPNADYYDIVKRGMDYYDAHPEFQNEEDGEAKEFYRWVNFWKNRVSTSGNNHGSFLPSSQAFQNLITDTEFGVILSARDKNLPCKRFVARVTTSGVSGQLQEIIQLRE